MKKRILIVLTPFIIVCGLIFIYSPSSQAADTTDSPVITTDGNTITIVTGSEAETAYLLKKLNELTAIQEIKEPVLAIPASWEMNSSLYPKHTKSLVILNHQVHFSDRMIACGDCHHDSKGKPLDLKADDPVERCGACHKETKKVKGEKLSKPEKIMKYHKEALHAKCIGCHKKSNIEKGDPKGKVPAPTNCTKCHPKKPKA